MFREWPRRLFATFLRAAFLASGLMRGRVQEGCWRLNIPFATLLEAGFFAVRVFRVQIEILIAIEEWVEFQRKARRNICSATGKRGSLRIEAAAAILNVGTAIQREFLRTIPFVIHQEEGFLLGAVVKVASLRAIAKRADQKPDLFDGLAAPGVVFDFEYLFASASGFGRDSPFQRNLRIARSQHLQPTRPVYDDTGNQYGGNRYQANFVHMFFARGQITQYSVRLA